MFAEYAARLSTHAVRAVREHGKELIDREMVQARLADLSVDLFALAACLSRTSGMVEKFGEDGQSAVRALTLTRAFSRVAEQRMSRNVQGLDRGDDEPWLRPADIALREGGYPFDVA